MYVSREDWVLRHIRALIVGAELVSEMLVYLNHIKLFTGILLLYTKLALTQFSALSSQKWVQCGIVLTV